MCPSTNCPQFFLQHFLKFHIYFKLFSVLDVVFMLSGVEVSGCWTATAGGRGMSTMVSRTDVLVFVAKLIILELLLPGLVTSV